MMAALERFERHFYEIVAADLTRPMNSFKDSLCSVPLAQPKAKSLV